MSSQQQPQLSQGNRMYLYRMLKAAIGTGRQTFITQIEEALAADGLAAEDMGFADARALMEALGDMVTLTVFKGGRVYATLVAQPEWDEALESADDSPKPAGGKSAGKPWKRKKGARGLKPVRPRIVPRETADEPANVETAESASAGQETPMALSETPATSQEAPARAPEALVAPEGSAEADVPATREAAADASGEAASHDAEEPTKHAASETDGAEQRGPSMPAKGDGLEPSAAANDSEENPSATAGDAGIGSPEPASDVQQERAETTSNAVQGAAGATGGEAPEATVRAPEPAFSLTVTFDPDRADAGVTTLESTPVTNEASTAETAAEAPSGGKLGANETAADEPEAKAADSNAATTEPRPVDLSMYPQDFAAEVYCPASIMAELAALLPYGADALGIAGEYFYIACLRGTADLSRGGASFPLYYLHDGERHAATVRLKKRAVSNLAWAIDAVEIDR
ncbi:hypothetical protein [Enorma massiliensis]|uniref:hypothetical protein n=1 Tax=Enorma massiliensis TaxID=1472761 RepID=UPI002E78A4CD|nr:hypothetical protein [Enorma massiliensis]